VTVKPPDAQVAVIFGASGDLTRRKLLPAFYHLFMEHLLPDGFAMVGYARTGLTDDEFRQRAREAITEFCRCEVTDEDWNEFAGRLSYVPGEFDSVLSMEHLREHLAEVDRVHRTEGRRFYYCATPATAYPTIATRLAESGLHRDAKIVLEKPFGSDLTSARELNDDLHRVFDESQIFRIDHYLGKESVQNALAFRFANGMFEPIWNRRYVAAVKITAAEDIGIEGRGSFYEQTGAIRDVVATHLFQVLTFFAMEPPVSFEPDRLRDETVRVLRSMLPIQPDQVVRGQYAGYRDEPDVAKDSQVETYAAMKVSIDNWRWAGVQFFLRAGKKLARKATEVALTFKEVPFNVFKGTDAVPLGRDALTFRIQPDEGISIELNIKRPGLGLEMDRGRLDFDYEQVYHAPLLEAYEYLLLEAMEGDHTLFLREDAVDRAWELLQPTLENPPPVLPYEAGSWGPEAADELVLPHHWRLALRGQMRR
jgi:glucose-6-phosphate 1-dehydrogenase